MQVTIELTDEQVKQVVSQLLQKIEEPIPAKGGRKNKKSEKPRKARIKLGVSKKWEGLDDSIYTTVVANGSLKSRQIYAIIKKMKRFKKLPWGTLSGHLNGMLKLNQLTYTEEGNAYIYSAASRIRRVV